MHNDNLPINHTTPAPKKTSAWQRLSSTVMLGNILLCSLAPPFHAMERPEQETNLSFTHNSFCPLPSKLSLQTQLEASSRDQLPPFQANPQANTTQLQSRWVKMLAQLKSLEELAALKQHCLTMLARKNQTPKVERRWNTRLKQLEELEHNTTLPPTIGKQKTTQETLPQPNVEDYPLLKHIFISPQAAVRLLGLSDLEKVKFINIPRKTNEWPKNLKVFSFMELKLLRALCIYMLNYEDLLIENNIWPGRLQKIEKLLEKRESKLQSQKTLALSSEFRSVRLSRHDEYKIRRIYINTKNPYRLDLHGVASAQLAQIKVVQFINAAKSKRKSHIHIITGKGNHKNHKNRRGILFKAFPGWVKSNKSVTGYTVGKGGGSYIVNLSPPSKILQLSQYRRFSLSKYLEQQVIFKKKHGKCHSLAYKQIHREIIQVRHKARQSEKNQKIYEALRTWVLLPESRNEELKGSTSTSEESENTLVSLQKPQLIDFLSEKQKMKLKFNSLQVFKE